MSEEIYECIICGEGWQILPQDRFCGFCGAPTSLMRLDLKSVETGFIVNQHDANSAPFIIFYEDEISQRESFIEINLTIVNDGSTPFCIDLDTIDFVEKS